ncbi:MAG TPA: DNA adenine methylase [Chthonomonadales bacterium]|nr:DNA adenine methylase [Chthonomonadales bacterium]
MVKYLGSKRVLAPAIVEAVTSTAGACSALDLFSGTARIGHALKRAGLRVIANDHNAFAATLARCYVQADAEQVLEDARQLVAELNALPGRSGYFTETYCVRSRYLHPANGARVDAIRECIAAKALERELEAVLLTSLLEAADRVDSTVGLQMAYLKRWAPRSLAPLELRVPDVLPRAPAGKGEAHCLDALDAAGRFEADVVYLDPPYNQHSYRGNYHVWETLVRWDMPEVYGVACKRTDCRTHLSAFNSRRQHAEALGRLLGALRCRTVVLSLSDEGWLGGEVASDMLGRLWDGEARVEVAEFVHPRHIGSAIGIHGPDGRPVGTPGPRRCRERLFVARRPDVAARSAPLALAGVGR